jgi:antirestriction protein
MLQWTLARYNLRVFYHHKYMDVPIRGTELQEALALQLEIQAFPNGRGYLRAADNLLKRRKPEEKRGNHKVTRPLTSSKSSARQYYQIPFVCEPSDVVDDMRRASGRLALNRS